MIRGFTTYDLRLTALLSLFIFTVHISSAQNLAPNPSFEDATYCPFGISDWPAVADWFSPTNTTPDYYNPCNNVANGGNGTVGVPQNSEGYRTAHTGDDYVGILCPQWQTATSSPFIWSEYVSAKLTQTLSAGHKYYVSFYVSHAEEPDYITQQYNDAATDNIGAVFTDTAIQVFLNVVTVPGQSLNIQPDVVSPAGLIITDTVNWTKIQGFYTATGGEQYITLGYFHSNNILASPVNYQMIKLYSNTVSNQAYYYLDDVCVTDLADAITSSKDTAAPCGQVLSLQGHTGGTQYNWNTGDTTSSIAINAPGTYWVAALGECAYYVDTFHVLFQPLVDTGAVAPCKGQQNGIAWVIPVSGDTNTYVYHWEDISGNTLQTHTSGHGDTLSGIGAGAYLVFVQGGNGCNTMIDVVVPPASYQASFTVDSIVCQQDTVYFQNTSAGTSAWYWNFGDGDTSVQADPTHIYTQPGSYTVTLTGSNGLCADTTSHSIIVDALPFVSFTADPKQICVGKAIDFYPTYMQGAETLLWSFGDSSQMNSMGAIMHSYATSGEMIVTLTAKYRVCPDTSFKDTVWVYPYPLVDIGPDTSMCPGQSPVVLSNLAAKSQPTDYTNVWSTGDTTAAITVNTPGAYWLTVTTDKGCSTNDTMVINPDCYLDIPNAFTPNGDGVNDYFFPRQFLSDGLTSFKMEIYNRWGELIFTTTSTDGRGWDGKFNNIPQPQGVFIYIIDATFEDGKTEHHQGNVTLLR